MAGGGAHGRTAGTAHSIITGAGLFLTLSQIFIMTWIQAGEDIIETGNGVVIDGTMNGFLTTGLTKTGGIGETTGTGKAEKPGTSINISLILQIKDMI
ncbi:MAG: hypothetical protein JW914_04300 [Syntrophaceae bacterium]|nr:hypothetical protein [Syntrophaceae bacterium]